MTAVPSIAEVPARPGRGTGPRHTADHCRLGPTNACLRRPALIVAECKKRLELLDCETIANRRSWTWADETVRFLVAGPNPGCDRAIERMWGKDRCTRRNPTINRQALEGVIEWVMTSSNFREAAPRCSRRTRHSRIYVPKGDIWRPLRGRDFLDCWLGSCRRGNRPPPHRSGSAPATNCLPCQGIARMPAKQAPQDR